MNKIIIIKKCSRGDTGETIETLPLSTLTCFQRWLMGVSRDTKCFSPLRFHKGAVSQAHAVGGRLIFESRVFLLFWLILNVGEGQTFEMVEIYFTSSTSFQKPMGRQGGMYAHESSHARELILPNGHASRNSSNTYATYLKFLTCLASKQVRETIPQSVIIWRLCCCIHPFFSTTFIFCRSSSSSQSFFCKAEFCRKKKLTLGQ